MLIAVLITVSSTSKDIFFARVCDPDSTRDVPKSHLGCPENYFKCPERIQDYLVIVLCPIRGIVIQSRCDFTGRDLRFRGLRFSKASFLQVLKERKKGRYREEGGERERKRENEDKREEYD